MNAVDDLKSRFEESEAFLQRVVWYPNFKRVYDDVLHRMMFGGRREEMLIVQGPVGTGKSFLREVIERDFLPIKTDERTSVQVLSCRYPPEKTITGLLGNLLEGMGDPVSDSCSVVRRRQRLKKQIKEQNTRLILIDEAQTMLPRGGGDEKTIGFKVLRELTDDLRIPIVLLGTEETSEVIKLDNALCSRVRSVFTLQRFSCKEYDDALDFADYISVLISHFPRKVHGWDFVEFHDDGGISLAPNINNLIRLVLATNGSQRSLKYLLSELIERTLPATRVTMKHCAEYYYSANNHEDKLNFNPFDADIKKVIKEAEKRGLYDSDNF